MSQLPFPGLLGAEFDAYHAARAVKPGEIVDCKRCRTRWAWASDGGLCYYCKEETMPEDVRVFLEALLRYGREWYTTYEGSWPTNPLEDERELIELFQEAEQLLSKYSED